MFAQLKDMQKRTRREPQRYCEYTEYGVINATRVDSEHAFCFVFCLEPDLGIVTDVVVKEEERGRGFGKQLVEKLKCVYSHRKLFCSSESSAEGFWEKMGTEVAFSDLPAVVRPHIDSWGHSKLKHYFIG